MPRISKRDQPPLPVRQIRAQLSELMASPDPEYQGRVIGDAVGIYAYFDYDGEPIYVGQTSSAFRDRVGRHLTGQRSDAVAKFILDPFEVAEVEMWSVVGVREARDGADPTKAASTSRKRALLDPYEFTVYKRIEADSRFGAVLNEGALKPSHFIELPPSVRGRIIPDMLWEERKHADTRIARRALTISRLSQMISEREVSGGMRRTLLLQAKRLAWLAEARVYEVGAEVPEPDDQEVDDE